jgi:hypothetical protein
MRRGISSTKESRDYHIINKVATIIGIAHFIFTVFVAFHSSSTASTLFEKGLVSRLKRYCNGATSAEKKD